MERIEYNAQTLGDIHSKLQIVDGIPILRMWSEELEDAEDPPMYVEFPIANLHYGHPHLPGRNARKAWFFDGGVLEFNDDDRGPDGRFIEIQLYDTNQVLFVFFLSRSVIREFEDILTRHFKAFTRKQIKEEKKQKGRNVAAFRQTMGNLRPENTPAGAWYYGSPNPVPEAFAAESGPGAKILEFLSGKRGTPKRQARGVKRQSVRRPPPPLSLLPTNNLPNLVPNRGGHRTRRNSEKSH